MDSSHCIKYVFWRSEKQEGFLPAGSGLQALSAVEVAHADRNQPGVVWSLRGETLKITGHPLIPINLGGFLGRLKNLAQQLSVALGFDEGGWALYLLSHAPPSLTSPSQNIATGPVPALDCAAIQDWLHVPATGHPT